jgi:hypothetical protein
MQNLMKRIASREQRFSPVVMFIAAAGKSGLSARDGNRRLGVATPESAGSGVELMVFHF